MSVLTVQRFRVFSFIEAASFLILLLVAMPLKYFAGLPLAVTIAGTAHGWIFVAYLVAVGFAAPKFGWRFGAIAGAFLALILPFGPFVFDRLVLAKSNH